VCCLMNDIVVQRVSTGLRCWHRTVIGLLFAISTVLLVWIGWETSPNRTETAHMAAGLYSWHTFRFDVFNVNPPLPRAIATVPVLLCSRKSDWDHVLPQDRCRYEWRLGGAFIAANDAKHIRWYFALGRWMCVSFFLLGGYMCCRLAKEVYGRASCLCALMLWCFSPMLLGWGATICPDVAASTMCLVTAYVFRQWLCQPCWDRALFAGLLLGLAELTKFTLLVFYPLLPTLWLLYRLPEYRQMHKWQWYCESAQVLLIMVFSVLIINVGYGFEGSFRPLGDYQFQTTMFTGYGSLGDIPPQGANRFAKTWLRILPVPLPYSYVYGIDTQRLDFERGLPSYLHGTWADHGWWHYYLYALAIKEPLGTWCLMALAIGATILGRAFSASWRDEMVVLAPGLVILAFVSSQTGFSVHSRYVIPALPFLFVWTSKVARVFEMRPFTRKRLAMATMVVLALIWSVGSSLAVYPHSLSYFNELTAVLPTPADASYPTPMEKTNENTVSTIISAGPRNGPRHLLDSNIDWGQDLFYLKDWFDEHPDVKLDGLAYWGSYPATLAGIPESPMPLPGPASNDPPPGSAVGGSGAINQATGSQLGPKPGWYALSVNYIYGRDHQYRYFLHFTPVAMAGYSIYIYHITLEEANRVRRELGLVEMNTEGGTRTEDDTTEGVNGEK
jgi:hypothetical protein